MDSKDAKIDWEFDAITFSRYEIILTIKTSNKLFQYIFNKARPKLEKQHGQKIEYREVKKFNVPEQYLKLLETTLINEMRKLSNILKKDKMEIISQKIEQAVYERVSAEWIIKIKYGGDYADKR